MKLMNAPGNKQRRRKVALTQRKRDVETHSTHAGWTFEKFCTVSDSKEFNSFPVTEKESLFKRFVSDSKKKAALAEKEVKVLEKRVKEYTGS
jgi:hypothetical protein